MGNFSDFYVLVDCFNCQSFITTKVISFLSRHILIIQFTVVWKLLLCCCCLIRSFPNPTSSKHISYFREILSILYFSLAVKDGWYINYQCWLNGRSISRSWGALDGCRRGEAEKFLNFRRGKNLATNKWKKRNLSGRGFEIVFKGCSTPCQTCGYFWFRLGIYNILIENLITVANPQGQIPRVCFGCI